MEIAKTLQKILKNTIVEASLDKTRPVDYLVRKTEEAWAADLTARRPAPAYREALDGEPIYKGTDLDLFTVMNALAQREAVINIPSYENMRATKIRPDQRVISKRNRHGQVYGITSNADVHSFSAKVKDYNVVQLLPGGREEVGAFRNFTLVDPTGHMYDGWHRVEFNATPEEQKFFRERELEIVPNLIEINNFVHPNLAMAFFGSRYWATKALANRVADEAKFYRTLASDLRNEGVRLGGIRPAKIRTYDIDEDLLKVKVKNLEAKLVLPEANGEYPIFGADANGKVKQYAGVPNNYVARQGILRFAEKRANELSYSLGPKVNAPVRAVELAFYLDGFRNSLRYEGNEKDPAWGIPDWTREYKEGPRSKIEWNALEIAPKTALLYRIKGTTVTVKV